MSWARSILEFTWTCQVRGGPDGYTWSQLVACMSLINSTLDCLSYVYRSSIEVILIKLNVKVITKQLVNKNHCTD